MDGLSRDLKQFALNELGFDLVGVCDASPLPGGAALSAWIEAGAHGEMAYMAATAKVRADPTRLLPGARSVISVAMTYHEGPEQPKAPGRTGRAVVARYAQRKDYHAVIRPRLVRLGRWLEGREPGAGWRVAVDTAPLLERDIAARAGLGWIGSNTCLINRHLGSEIFLGELVTTLDLPRDAAAGAHCGRCTACIDACPTGAIIGPGRLDARRCIAYLTIEHRSALPDGLVDRLAPHLFGCDICQAVCPWNRKAPLVGPGPLARRAHLAELETAELDGLDAEGWRRLAAGSPLRRLDFSRLRRNLAAIALTRGPETRSGSSRALEAESGVAFPHPHRSSARGGGEGGHCEPRPEELDSREAQV